MAVVIRSHSITMIGLVAAALLLATCHEADRPSASLDRAASDPREAVDSVPIPEGCLPVWPAAVGLSGMLREDERFGPPGYGETPDRDERVRVVLLELKVPIDVCGDPSVDGPQRVAKEVTIVQLTGSIARDAAKRLDSRSVVVYGQLRRRALSHDFEEVLLRVDSIPLLRTQLRQTG